MAREIFLIMIDTPNHDLSNAFKHTPQFRTFRWYETRLVQPLHLLQLNVQRHYSSVQQKLTTITIRHRAQAQRGQWQ